MRKLTVTTFLSLDGVMQAPGGPAEDRSGGFQHGGWLVPYADGDMGRIVSERFANADGFLLGRRTYEIFAAHWPHVQDPSDTVAHALNSLPKYIASHTLQHAEWSNSTVIQGDVAAEVKRLKQQPGRELQVHGSGTLIQTLMQHDLIDEYCLWIYPVLLGSGKRLFASGTVPLALKLLDSTMTSTGVAVQTYGRDGELRHGSFSLDNYQETRDLLKF